MKKNACIHIYTGEGKGKTTAAAGLAVRANAQGMKVCYISFHKGPKFYKNGEQKNLKKLGISIRCFARTHSLCRNKTKVIVDGLCLECIKGLNYIKKVYKENNYDMLIVDEINICVRDGFLNEKDVLELMQEKPQNLELVLTGRGATKKMIQKADVVSFIKEVKHPYKKGIPARKGIEY